MDPTEVTAADLIMIDLAKMLEPIFKERGWVYHDDLKGPPDRARLFEMLTYIMESCERQGTVHGPDESYYTACGRLRIEWDPSSHEYRVFLEIGTI